MLLLIGPYSLLFYKKMSLRIRLLFISMFEIFILCMLLIAIFLGAEKLIGTTYLYNIFVWLSVLLNLILIFLSWLFEKIKPIINKPKL
jgi:hypothetical protein